MSFQVMAWAVKQKCDNPSQKLVLLLLADHTNGHTGQCNPSHELLAEECCMSVSSLKTQISSLEKLGFLTKIQKTVCGLKRPNQYILHFANDSQNLTIDSQNNSDYDSQDLTIDSLQFDYKPRTNKQEKKQELEPKASARKKKTTDFDVKQWTNENLPQFVNKEKWLQWQALRKSQRCSMTDSTLRRDLNVLIDLWEQHQISSEIALDKAIKGKGGNGWQSLDIDYFDREIAKKAQQGIVPYAQQTAPPKQTKNQQAINRTLNAFDDFDNNFIDGGVL